MKYSFVFFALFLSAEILICSAQSWRAEGALATVKANRMCRHFDDGKLVISQNEKASVYIWDYFGLGPFTTPGEDVIFEIDGVNYHSIALPSSGPKVVNAPASREIISALKSGNVLKLKTTYADEWLIFSLSGSASALSAIGY